MTRVYLYSDNPISAIGLGNVLMPTGQFQLESFSGGIHQLLTRADISPPGIVVLDLEPDHIIGALQDLRSISSKSAVVLWVNDISIEIAFQALGLGARGVLRKSLPVDLQVKCLRSVHAGELWFEKALTDRFLSAKHVSLTPREGQLITLLSHGMKNKEIAATLGITEGTVKVYLSKLFDKVGAKDRFELAMYGLKNLTVCQAQITPTDKGVSHVPSLRSMMLEKHCGAKN